MTSSARAQSSTTRSADTEYSFFEALSLGPPNDQFSLVTEDKLGLRNPRPTAAPLPAATPNKTEEASGSVPPVPYKLHPGPNRNQQEKKTLNKGPAQMAPTAKAQGQCLESCERATKAGDRISVRMLEYLTSVKQGHLPQGLDDLAHSFLSTCQVLLTLKAGLEECTRTAQYFPADLLAELDKKFRVCQADFNLLDQTLGKVLEAERKGHGAMGKMKRGWSKLFGDIDFTKMTMALDNTQESLRMSALMFQWSLGSDKIESGMGIGFTGLAAALNRLDQRRNGVDSTKSTEAASSQSNLAQGRPTDQPPLPPLPWSDRPTHGGHGQEAVSDSRTPVSELRQWSATSPSSVASNERNSHANGFDHLSSFEETLSHHTGSESVNEGLLEEIAALDLGTAGKGAVRHKIDYLTLPRWTPRNRTAGDGAGLRGALTSAIRAKNHKLVEQLLDRGASPNTGPEVNALNEAVRVQDSETVRLLLFFGADPNERDRDGMTPLALAVERSFLAGAVTLVKYGADPDLKAGMDPDNDSPLSRATCANKVNLAHLLLMYGGDVNQKDSEGNTILIGAINKKTPAKLVELLLEYGADPNAKSSEGKTALFEAITCSRVDIVTSLLDHGANPNLPGPKHMLWPATYKAPCLQVLLAHGADHRKCPGIMELAASVNNIDSVRILLKAGVDPNAKKDGVYTPLCTSIRDDRADIFQLLLSNGANPNVPASEYPTFKCITHNRLQYLPPLVAAGADLHNPKGIVETAVSSNNVEALTWLLDQGLDPNERCPKGRSPLTTAIRDKRVEMVNLLLMRGADPNKRGEDWPLCMAVHTPAILRRMLAVLAEPRAFKGVVERAVAANQLESVKLLLAAGVSVEDKNGGVFSPLTTALREDRRDIVRYLVDPKGGNADVNAPGEHLPIVKALRRYHGEDTDMIELLLDHGADPNRIYRGWNAVFQAVENGDMNVLRLLVEKGGGVDVEVMDEMGRTAVEMASQRGWDEAVEVMREGRIR
ncbi:Ankyrin-like protein [Hapsidospora chrysogenum ATCC 11550]|uniref:Ankyrin-like protein n=1 Tax=Hapsidospora chrysogenum (strain ATCC 11550 / CBS 779.69 / DSM 880 / IAM 14645 / JCM 23072 / IMI 49137) TaxID=857340 RepID=A0A086TEH6_HAPC1|nr:Ankyrin-like protein [Hapsidospora chrysogenum ATCC 11550]